MKRINHKGKSYVIYDIDYKEYKLPVLLDEDIYYKVKKMDKNWHYDQNGFVYCSHSYNGKNKNVYLHEIVMLLDNNNKKNTIQHINRIGLDNRRENLMYDTLNKFTNKNCKKKKRTLQLPSDSGIIPDEIPTYVWYVRSEHGDKFIVKIGDIYWSTNNSKDMSMRHKLEEAKSFLRNLFKTRPDLVDEYCMNGDYTKEGKMLLDSYYDIVLSNGYDYIERVIPEFNTKNYLKPVKI